MLIPKTYRLDDLLRKDEGDRLVLKHVGVERYEFREGYQQLLSTQFGMDFKPNGVCVATDGYGLAIVPCQIDAEDDVPAEGCVVAFDAAPTLAAARKLRPGTLSFLRIERDVVRFDRYTSIQRKQVGADGQTFPYPDWRKPVSTIMGLPDGKGHSEPSTGSRFRVVFDTSLAQNVALAIGSPQVALSFKDIRAGALVYPVGQTPVFRDTQDELPLPPYGAVMPMQSGWPRTSLPTA